MNNLLEILRIGGLRSRIELKQFMRQRESVVFTTLSLHDALPIDRKSVV